MLGNIILCPGASLLWLLIIRSHMLDWKCNTTSKTCRQQQESLQKLQFTDVIYTFSHVYSTFIELIFNHIWGGILDTACADALF